MGRERVPEASPEAACDALIVGGGPAGATAGRLLAQWGYSVAIETRPPARSALAECLPPSTGKLFRLLGVEEEVERAGFYRTTGNTVWWGGGRRVEMYPEGAGWQVRRGQLDALLLELARRAGADVSTRAWTRRARVPAPRFTIDGSGRAGVLGRDLRVREPNSRTVALCGTWRNNDGWDVPDPCHTLIEAYADGWAWSVPVSPHERCVAFMIDPGETRGARYECELAKTREFRRIFAKGSAGEPWTCDASVYSSRRFCGDDFLLVGDAGSFVDPLSSFGVRKAMLSGWMAAVVVNTCLRRPEMRQTALDYFDARERQIYADCKRRSAELFREASFEFARPFWERRADEPDLSDAAAALVRLKAQRSIRLVAAVKDGRVPAIDGREVVLLDSVEGVNVQRLVEIAPLHAQVPDLFEAYNRAFTPVALPAFLAALATLLARGILVNRDV